MQTYTLARTYKHVAYASLRTVPYAITCEGEAYTQMASSLHMDDLWLIVEVQSLLNSSKLQEPVNGHVV